MAALPLTQTFFFGFVFNWQMACCQFDFNSKSISQKIFGEFFSQKSLVTPKFIIRRHMKF